MKFVSITPSELWAIYVRKECEAYIALVISEGRITCLQNYYGNSTRCCFSSLSHALDTVRSMGDRPLVNKYILSG